MELKTDVVLFSKSVLTHDELRARLKMTVTNLSDSGGIRKGSVLQLANAIAEIQGSKSPTRTPIKEHTHVGLLCILPDATILQVLTRSNGLVVSPVSNVEGIGLFILSGTLDAWERSITKWLEQPTRTLREFTSLTINVLNSVGAMIQGVVEKNGLYHLEHK